MYTWEGGLLPQNEFLSKVSSLLNNKWLINTNKNVYYYNVPAGFDIEVSSFYLNGEKRACMYVWQFGVYSYVTYGRTWHEFQNLIEILIQVLHLGEDRKLIVYVHNLPYEFQFIRKIFEWDKVFLLKERKPVYADTHGIEFRCNLKLAGGKSLDSVAKDLQKYKVKKMVGNLDYSLIRTPLTPLSDEELLYCENDIRVILSYIQEKIEQDGDITKIPLTNTGYVREFSRKNCFRRWKKYHNLMKQLTIEPSEYSQLKRCFAGGFTHANNHYVDKVMCNVGSHDLRSSYPAVMVLEKFPMGKGQYIVDGLTEKDLEELFLTKCVMMDIELWNVYPKIHYEHAISRSKCTILEDYVIDNGRVVMAGHLRTTVTETDYFVIREFYEWDSIAISNIWIYEKNYLPKPFVESVLDLYGKKTTLKGITEELLNYMISKNMINACYGMVVTDPVRDELMYEYNNFYTQKADIVESIERYNKNIRRFLFYPWGVWITSYARANLFSSIIAMGDDYVYSDTDSNKCINPQNHELYFKRYNEQIMEKIEASASHFHLSKQLYMPKTIKGVPQVIGTWADEGIYTRFKTLGAKRYLTERPETQTIEENGISLQLTKMEYELTVAGTNKRKSMHYLRTTLNAFDNFKTGLVIPESSSGRLALTYIDDETEGDIVDYKGVPYHFHELSSVHMEPTEYSLDRSKEFSDYLLGVIDFGE